MRLAFYILIFLSANNVFAQNNNTKEKQEKPKKIELLHANSLQFDKNLGNGAKRLIGDVQLKHDSAIMYCDSAYLYDNNSMDAFGNVRIKQGDTLSMYGDSLNYDGNTRIAKLRGNVRATNPDMTLTTDYLDYDRGNDVAYYVAGGEIINRKENNKLTSNIGYYYPKSRTFHFKDSVVMRNPDYTINSDTLQYNTFSEITYFFGPTTIESDGNFIYCENGLYDTKANQAQFEDNAYIVSGGQTVKGDSIFYDRNEKFGEAFCNVSIIDTSQDIVLTGDYTINYEEDSISIITDTPMLTQYFKGDDTLYLHGDTLLATYDSTGKHRVMYAYNHVKFFKNDMQGKCDSLIFSNADSTIQLYNDPILWSDDNQITADYIEILMYSGEVKGMDMKENAFITSSEGKERYNQIKGNDMKGHFKDNKLNKVEVFKNGKTVYYAKEDTGKYIGINRADCEDLVIYIDSNKVKEILFLNKPKAVLYPMNKAPKNEITLEGLNWRDNIRPKKKSDIFYWEPQIEPLDTLAMGNDSLIDNDSLIEKQDTAAVAPKEPIEKEVEPKEEKVQKGRGGATKKGNNTDSSGKEKEKAAEPKKKKKNKKERKKK